MYLGADDTFYIVLPYFNLIEVRRLNHALRRSSCKINIGLNSVSTSSDDNAAHQQIFFKKV